MKKSNEVNSVKKALAIFDLFTVEEPELTISEMTVKLNLPRPTVARIVYTLNSEGYLKRNPISRKYSLGLKLFRLSTVIQKSMQLTRVAEPVLRSLRDDLGETVYLDLLDGYERVCAISLEGNQLLRTVVPVGQRSPLYAGADGRVILAYRPENILFEMIAKTGLQSFTENTITDPGALREELARIRKDGVAVSYAECTPGSVGIACPIWDRHGEVIAGVAISSPHSRLTEDLLS